MKLFVDSRHASPYAMSAYVALVEKGLAFTTVPLDLDAGAQQAPDYRALSLTGRVPTLVDGDFALSESTAITEYLDETRPGVALYPREPRARARARQVQAWLRSDMAAIREERTTVVVFYGPVATPLSSAAQAAAERLFEAAGRLLAHGGSHLEGSTWSLADVDLALMLNRLVLNGDPVPEPLARYARAQWQRPSVQRWVGIARPPL